MSTAITELFGTNVFSVSVMRERLPKKVFAEVTRCDGEWRQHQHEPPPMWWPTP